MVQRDRKDLPLTLPTNITLPISEKDEYLRDLTYALSTYMQQTNFECNGTYNKITEANNYKFITGGTAEGTATYTNSVIFTQRSNLIVHAWFDITWSGHTGTGTLRIVLPYFSQVVNQTPYVCAIEASGITYGAGFTYVVGSLLPNNNVLRIKICGSGIASAFLQVPASGTLRGSITYAGQQFR